MTAARPLNHSSTQLAAMASALDATEPSPVPVEEEHSCWSYGTPFQVLKVQATPQEYRDWSLKVMWTMASEGFFDYMQYLDQVVKLGTKLNRSPTGSKSKKKKAQSYDEWLSAKLRRIYPKNTCSDEQYERLLRGTYLDLHKLDNEVIAIMFKTVGLMDAHLPLLRLDTMRDVWVFLERLYVKKGTEEDATE